MALTSLSVGSVEWGFGVGWRPWVHAADCWTVFRAFSRLASLKKLALQLQSWDFLTSCGIDVAGPLRDLEGLVVEDVLDGSLEVHSMTPAPTTTDTTAGTGNNRDPPRALWSAAETPGAPRKLQVTMTTSVSAAVANRTCSSKYLLTSMLALFGSHRHFTPVCTMHVAEHMHVHAQYTRIRGSLGAGPGQLLSATAKLAHLQRMQLQLCWACLPLCAVPGGALAGCSQAFCCFLVHVLYAHTLCCCSSSCAAAGHDLLRSCHACSCNGTPVDVNNTENPPQPASLQMAPHAHAGLTCYNSVFSEGGESC